MENEFNRQMIRHFNSAINEAIMSNLIFTPEVFHVDQAVQIELSTGVVIRISVELTEDQFQIKEEKWKIK